MPSELQVRKDDIAKTRIVEKKAKRIGEGEILLAVDSFALTANNVTYAAVGETFGYWKFFPADAEFGVVPAWGFADVVESKCADISPGERLYGFLPMAEQLVMRPSAVSAQRLVDGAAHREGLPAVYNSYARLSGETWNDQSMNAERMLLFPLYATSFFLCDFLLDNDWFGASQVVVGSASSKTAIGLAYALGAEAGAPITVGLTSRGQAARVKALELYGAVATYDAIEAIDNAKPTVIVDMSGDGAVLSALHAHLGGALQHCCNVGVTHHDRTERDARFNAEKSAMFFAPAHIQKRVAEWGPAAFERKTFEFWREAALKSRDWLNIESLKGLATAERAWSSVRQGKSEPDTGLIVRL